MRHNRVRDLEAALMKEVCHNVQIEPELLPIADETTRSGNLKKKARLDVAGVGVWGEFERTFLDIRIMHPNCPTYANNPIDQVYETHEKSKKRCYNERVLQVEKGSFTPIVGSTFGGWGNEAKGSSGRSMHKHESRENRAMRVLQVTWKLVEQPREYG